MSYASVMGIKSDIHLTKSDYSWLGSMFYFGELLLLSAREAEMNLTICSV